jgi:hypothetical protein
MKSSAFFAAAILAAAATPALAGPASDFVKSFYTEIEDPADPGNRDKFVDPAKTKLDQNDKTPEGDVGCIDGALALDAQDFDEDVVKKTLKLDEKVSGDAATVTADFKLFDDNQPDSKREVLWSLKKVSGGWKVADIADAANEWKLSTLDCGSQ